MSDTSSALPESPESVSSHNALSTGQQTVINKLFRRLIVFLFVLFIFSFLDRINIGFAGVDDGAGSGVKRHHVWSCHDAVLRYLRHFRHSQQRDVEHRRRPATGLRPLWCYGALHLPPRCSRWDRKACMCCECWWALPKRAFCQEYCSI
ncbi:4-hydroxyphenylacetate permease [Salmonella enterica subsp. enterica]|uniref:4-hydroxyphenylacetate permease n=1 Tax=Salmonella enterica I TaxID=59201 RepID=A0A447U5B8_SALET|nr:4-hydroxyphenylacetate permease [Salmonella enterica subsp. enterica]